MARGANVHSIDVISEFRNALIKFRKLAEDEVSAAGMEGRRILDWVSFDQQNHWKREIRRREERLLQAKSELSRRKGSKIGGETADCTEQIIMVRRAKHELEQAVDKLKQCKRWTSALQLAMNDFDGKARPLVGLLDSDVPRALALINHALDSLEAYLELTAPTGDVQNVMPPGDDVSSVARTGTDINMRESEDGDDGEPKGGNPE